MQLKACPNALHMVFKGNSGTGKATVVRILGRILRDIGILSKGQLVEVERADLAGECIGHTTQKNWELLKKSLRGIMFIDEAYTLSQGGEKDFGREAVSTHYGSRNFHTMVIHRTFLRCSASTALCRLYARRA